MTDENPNSGSVVLDLVFAAGSMITIGAIMFGFHSLLEALRRKDKKEVVER